MFALTGNVVTLSVLIDDVNQWKLSTYHLIAHVQYFTYFVIIKFSVCPWTRIEMEGGGITSQRPRISFLIMEVIQDLSNAVLQLPAHAGSSLEDFSTLKMEAIRSSETSVQSTISTRRHTPEDGILHSHRRGNLKSYILISLDIREGICWFTLNDKFLWTTFWILPFLLRGKMWRSNLGAFRDVGLILIKLNDVDCINSM
jgi:hypothetical protein